MNPLHRTALCWLLLLATHSLQAAAAEARSSGPDSEARQLVADILGQQPEKKSVLYGALRLRDTEGRRREIPLRYTILPGTNGWTGIYETQSTPWRGAERLTIMHRFPDTNEYLHAPAGSPGGAAGSEVRLEGGQAAVPFAGSDYWLSDLGLEFLHWPQQRLVRDAQITMRKGRACRVVESVNPKPAPNAYARVVSWLDAETGAPIYAEGYDTAGNRMKTFSLRGFTKVNGQWQPRELEMLDEKTDSRTGLSLSFEAAN